MKVSLCTTCKNRLHHLEQTLPYNIEANKQAEFILVDYYSTDGLCEWIRDNLKTEINTGKLTYYRLSKPTDYFCLSHAINIGFKKATGDIVCNIDADNFTGNNFDIHLLEIFNREKIIAESVSGYGLTGRKAYWRKEFIDILGGYDEDFTGFAGEDDDLIGRFKKIGLRYHPTGAEVVHLFHQSVRLDPNWAVGREYNRKLLRGRSRGSPIRNIGRNWGQI